MYFGGSLDTLSAAHYAAKKSPGMQSTVNSSGLGSTTGFSYDPTPDFTSFAPRGANLKNEAADIGIKFRSQQTATGTSKETYDIASMVSRSMVLSRAHHRQQQQPNFPDEDEIIPFKSEETNSLLSKTFAANPDGTLFEITEKLLLRDILFVFQGIEGRLVKYDTGMDAYRISSDYGVPLPVRDLVSKLAELGWLCRRVRKYLDARAGDKALGLVGQSFCAAIQKELTEYYRLVAVLEAQGNQEDDGVIQQGGGLTLRRLMIWTYDPLLRMRALASLVDLCKG